MARVCNTTRRGRQRAVSSGYVRVLRSAGRLAMCADSHPFICRGEAPDAGSSCLTLEERGRLAGSGGFRGSSE